jgi:hypothetical protein
MFRSGPRNFYETEEVEVDIVRGGEEVSVAITKIETGYRMNSADDFTNKKFKPPIHKEAMTLNAFDLLSRIPGDDPFADTTIQQRLTVRALQSFRKPEEKIKRAIELQASQVMQTGTADLKDENGNTIYSIDYKPKATHFPTAVNEWDDAGSTKLADLENLCDVIREDGLGDADTALFGATAWNLFIQDSSVQALLDNRRMFLGGIAPVARGDGAKFMGTIEVGDCKLEMWIYSGRFKDPDGGASTRYMATNKVMVRDSTMRLDATFGAIPRIVPVDSRVLPFVPPRISFEGGGMDLFTTAWVDPQGQNLYTGVGARPLMIPTAIDSFGCLDINI